MKTEDVIRDQIRKEERYLISEAMFAEHILTARTRIRTLKWVLEEQE